MKLSEKAKEKMRMRFKLMSKKCLN